MKCFRGALKIAKCWIVGHKLRAAVLGVVLLVAAPWPAKAQFVDPCCAIMAAGLASISSALQNVIGGGLSQILGVDQSIQQFEQNTVWPQTLSNRARALVGGLQGIFYQIQSLTQIRVNSASLSNSQQLETTLLSRN